MAVKNIISAGIGFGGSPKFIVTRGLSTSPQLVYQETGTGVMDMIGGGSSIEDRWVAAMKAFSGDDALVSKVGEDVLVIRSGDTEIKVWQS